MQQPAKYKFMKACNNLQKVSLLIGYDIVSNDS